MGGWLALYQALGEEFRRRDGPAGDDVFRDDLVAHLDQDRRLQVRVPDALA